MSGELRREREAKGWSVDDLAQVLWTSDGKVGQLDSWRRSVRRWEAGTEASAENRRRIANALGLPVAALFPAPPAYVEVTGETAELLERIRSSDVGGSTLDTIEAGIETLMHRYPTDPAAELEVEASRWLASIEAALQRRVTPAQVTGLYTSAAWLALLVGCLRNDLGDRVGAEQHRAIGARLAIDAGDRRAIGWSHEMSSLFAMTEGDWRRVVAAAAAGLEVAPDSDVAVQLLGQQAEALAGLGEAEAAHQALDQATEIHGRLPYNYTPDRHFTVDYQRVQKARMRVGSALGDVDLVTDLAARIIAEGIRPDGSHRQPMRVAITRCTMAVVSARAGDADEALSLVGEALAVPRISLPSVMRGAVEVRALLPDRQADELGDMLRAMA